MVFLQKNFTVWSFLLSLLWKNEIKKSLKKILNKNEEFSISKDEHLNLRNKQNNKDIEIPRHVIASGVVGGR